MEIRARIQELISPINTRSGAMYRDIKISELTSEERTVIVQFLLGEVDMGVAVPTVGQFARNHRVHKDAIHYWIRRYNQGQHIYEYGGRSRTIDSQAMMDIKAAVNQAQREKNPPTIQETRAIIVREANNTRKRHHEAPKPTYSDNSTRKAMKACEIVPRMPQKITTARLNACSDLRMSYTLYIMLKACTESLSPAMMWNWDSTQFITNTSGTSEKVCVIKNAINEPVTAVADDTLPVAMKWFHMASANGEYAPFVLMVAIKELKPNQFFHYEVPSLSQSAHSALTGHLCFCKTRVGNDAFFDWFVTKIAIPTVASCRRINSIVVSILAIKLFFSIVYFAAQC